MKKNANILSEGAGTYALFAKIPYGGAYAGFEEFGQFGNDSMWAFWLNWSGDNSACFFWVRFADYDIRVNPSPSVVVSEFNTWGGQVPMIFYKINEADEVIELYAYNHIGGRTGVVQMLAQSYNRNIQLIDRNTVQISEDELTEASVLNRPTIEGVTVQQFTGETKTVPKNGGNGSWDINVAKNGYTPIAITGIDLNSYNVQVNRYSIQNNHLYATLVNTTETDASVIPKFFVLYKTNVIW